MTMGKFSDASAPLPGCLYPGPEFSVPRESKIINTANTSCFRWKLCILKETTMRICVLLTK